MSDELERRLADPSVPPIDVGALRSRLATRAADAGLLDVAYGVVDSPLGPLTVIVTPRGLVRLSSTSLSNISSGGGETALLVVDA